MDITNPKAIEIIEQAIAELQDANEQGIVWTDAQKRTFLDFLFAGIEDGKCKACELNIEH